MGYEYKNEYEYDFLNQLLILKIIMCHTNLRPEPTLLLVSHRAWERGFWEQYCFESRKSYSYSYPNLKVRNEWKLFPVFCILNFVFSHVALQHSSLRPVGFQNPICVVSDYAYQSSARNRGHWMERIFMHHTPSLHFNYVYRYSVRHSAGSYSHDKISCLTWWCFGPPKNHWPKYFANSFKCRGIELSNHAICSIFGSFLADTSQFEYCRLLDLRWMFTEFNFDEVFNGKNESDIKSYRTEL